MSKENNRTNTDLITRLSQFPVNSLSASGFDINRFKDEVDEVNLDINTFIEFAVEYKKKDFLGKFFTGDINDKIITATNAIARLGRLTLELQAVTSVIAAEIHSNTNKLNAQQSIINTQQNALEEQGLIVIGLPKKLEVYSEKVAEIRTQLKEKIDGELAAIRLQLINLDPDSIKSWKDEQAENIRNIHKSLSDALSLWANEFKSQIAEIQSSLSVRYSELAHSYELMSAELASNTQKLSSDIQTVESKSNERYVELNRSSELLSAEFASNTKKLGSEIQLVESKSDERYVELNRSAELLSAELASNTKKLSSEIQLVESKSDACYVELNRSAELLSAELVSNTKKLSSEIKLVESKSDERFVELHRSDELMSAELASKTQKLSTEIKLVESKSDEHYGELNRSAELMKAEMIDSLSTQQELNQMKIRRLVTSLVFLSLAEFGLIAYLYFR